MAGVELVLIAVDRMDREQRRRRQKPSMATANRRFDIFRFSREYKIYNFHL